MIEPRKKQQQQHGIHNEGKKFVRLMFYQSPFQHTMLYIELFILVFHVIANCIYFVAPHWGRVWMKEIENAFEWRAHFKMYLEYFFRLLYPLIFV